MTFEEWGATLKAEREKRNLSIDDVASELKISPRQLRALEDGDMAALPHPAYAKGFIRSYATWLGLSNDEIHNALENVSAPKARKNPEPDNVFLPEPEPQRGGAGRALFFLIFLAAICGGLYYAWDTGMIEELKNRFLPQSNMSEKLQSADKYMAAKDQAEAEKAEQAKKEEQGGASEAAEPQVTLPLPGNHNETVLAPIPYASPGNSTEQADADMRVAENSQREATRPENAEAPAEEAATPGQHKLIITATEECWVHSNADKTDTRQFSLRKGDTFSLAFSKSLELKLGNAGGVQLRYDGKDLPPAGTSGQVKTIRFPPPETQ